MTTPLHVLANRDASKQGASALDVDADDADRLLVAAKNQSKVAMTVFIRVMRVIRGAAASRLEEHAPPNGVIRGPVGQRRRRAERVPGFLLARRAVPRQAVGPAE